MFTLYRQRWRMLVTVAAAGRRRGRLFACSTASSRPTAAPSSTSTAPRPLTSRGFPHGGVAVVAAVVTAAAPWLSRRWRRAGWALIFGLRSSRFLDSPVSFDSARRRRRLARGARRARRPRRAVPAADHGRPSSTGSPPSACPCSSSNGPASTPAGPRPTSASPATARSCSSRRSATTSAAPTCCSASTAAPAARLRRRAAVLLAAARRRARGVRRARAPATSACAPRAAGVRHCRAERLRPRLRGDRRPVPRPARPAEVTDDVLAAIWDLVGSCAATASPIATSAWPTSSSTTTARSG